MAKGAKSYELVFYAGGDNFICIQSGEIVNESEGERHQVKKVTQNCFTLICKFTDSIPNTKIWYWFRLWLTGVSMCVFMTAEATTVPVKQLATCLQIQPAQEKYLESSMLTLSQGPYESALAPGHPGSCGQNSFVLWRWKIERTLECGGEQERKNSVCADFMVKI